MCVITALLQRRCVISRSLPIVLEVDVGRFALGIPLVTSHSTEESVGSARGVDDSHVQIRGTTTAIVSWMTTVTITVTTPRTMLMRYIHFLYRVTYVTPVDLVKEVICLVTVGDVVRKEASET